MTTLEKIRTDNARRSRERRKRLADEGRRVVTVYLPEAARYHLKRLTKQRSLTQSEVIEKAIADLFLKIVRGRE